MGVKKKDSKAVYVSYQSDDDNKFPNRFDDWVDVRECNDCEHYWTNTCDGVRIGQKRPCTAFIATRNINIPLKIKRLESALQRILGVLLIIGLWLVIITVVVVAATAK